MLKQITPLILTYNEGPNIRQTLDRLTWAEDIVVVDSFSNDETLEIVGQYKQARVLKRQFSSFSDQCNFGLTEGRINTEWVLNLDADYVLTDEFVEELKGLQPDSAIDGYKARFIYCINGQRLRSGIYPPVTVLFRKAKGTYTVDGHAHRVVIDGQVGELGSAILHDDRKPLNRWFEAQKRYSELEARKLLTTDSKMLNWKDRIRKWRVVAPPAMFFYCMIVRGGILDGWAGFYYAFQRTYAELLLSLRLLEARQTRK
jgi:glycosyltransferase involved in cell wall biosynthesis